MHNTINYITMPNIIKIYIFLTNGNIDSITYFNNIRVLVVLLYTNISDINVDSTSQFLTYLTKFLETDEKLQFYKNTVEYETYSFFETRIKRVLFCIIICCGHAFTVSIIQ